MSLPLRSNLLFLLAAWTSVSLSATRTPASDPLTTIRVSEGTSLGFDLSPDGRSIVFDLLGQLWLIPAQGGAAKPITDAVREVAEDLDPSFAPDGRRVLFRGERKGRIGLWLLDLESSVTRQLTQVPDPTAYEGEAAWSPDGRMVAFARAGPDFAAKRLRSDVTLLDVEFGTARALPIEGLPNPMVGDPVWVQDGKQIAFVARNARSERGGRIWIVDASGGRASPLTEDSVRALAPAFSADGQRMAYFAPDSAGRLQVWVRQMPTADDGGRPATQITNQSDVTPTRIRWFRNANAILYSANGRLWKATIAGGQPAEIPFSANLTLSVPSHKLPPPRFPEAGRPEPARGFMGLALSPDGRQIGVLALGKLWVIPIGASPRAVTDVPFTATSLAWSPDGGEIAWSAGVPDEADLFAIDLKTGESRRITALPGRESSPTYSPDGRHVAFVHTQGEAVLRLVDAHASTITDAAQTKSLGPIGANGTSPPLWSPDSDGLLVPGEANLNEPGRATFVPLAGERHDVTRFPDAPIFLQWTSHGITFVRHDRFWQARFDRTGMLADPQPIGNSAALYASSSRDGSLLFVSDGGLRLRAPDGAEQKIGWPITYTPPTAEPTLIRNVRIVDGTGGPIAAPRDLLIEGGRIVRIAPVRTLPAGAAHVLDAAGRIVMPGLIDLHAHTYRPDLLPGFLYFGTTTVRDQGSSMAPLVAYADAIAAGFLPGPRVAYGGFQFYSDWPFDDEQGRGIEPEADADHITRAVALAEAFGAQHIKTRTFRRWDINARMITEAHRRGMRATGHCAHQLPLVAAGMDAKEHIGLCETRGNTYLYEDLIQLFRAAGIGVVPTIAYLDFAVRLNERPALLDDDAEIAPFLPARDSFEWMLKLSPENRQDWAEDARRAREAAAKLWRAGVTIGTGTDVWQVPTGVHMELEQLVAAGLTPAEAIRAGTSGAARILGADKDLGTIEVGRRADLVLLDANPLVDIRNTRRIWTVVRDGRIVDRTAILAMATGAATSIPPTADFPIKPVRLIEPFGAGGGVDVISRPIAKKLSELWGQPVTVENHTGAGSTAAPALVAKASPDGYTLLVNSSAQAYAAVLRKDVPYDPVKDFIPVAPLTSQGYVLVASKAVGATTVAELIAAAKKRPTALRFGSPGAGSGAHFGILKFNLETGLRAVHVPADAIADAIADTIAGKTDYLLAPIPLAARDIRAGDLIPLGVSSVRRSPLLPDVPTIAEAGIAGFDYSIWYGVWAPARTPAAVVDKLARDIAQVVAAPDLREWLTSHGGQPMTMTQAAFARFVLSESEAAARIIRAGVTSRDPKPR
jgi:tripartite-type tricarboxylate transporter receptor subunit TctC/imidazolonepropionase-like amidohydrolase/Tol biopolymer transport system component